MQTKFNITDPTIIEHAIALTGASLLEGIAELPGIAGVPGAYEAVVAAGQIAYAEAYKVYSLITPKFSKSHLLICLVVCLLYIHCFWWREYHRSVFPWGHQQLHG